VPEYASRWQAAAMAWSAEPLGFEKLLQWNPESKAVSEGQHEPREARYDVEPLSFRAIKDLAIFHCTVRRKRRGRLLAVG
jgi:hypothetical protein